MKSYLIALFLCLSVLKMNGQTLSTNPMLPDSKKKMLLVDAACGECRFGLQGKGCDLAVRIKGKTYFVDGTDIDSHGDAHAKDGFCNTTRKAEVQGEIVNNRFKATYFKLISKAAPKN